MQTKEVMEKLERAYFSEEMDEKKIIDALPRLLRDGGLFVDVGASLGQYTYHASKVMKNGRIVAIEADPLRFERLKDNCEKWSGLSSNRIECIHAAVDERAGKTDFFTTDSHVSGALFEHDLRQLPYEQARDVEFRRIEVDAISLDDALEDGVPDLVKMDIEGAELRALRGARRLLRNDGVFWLVEIHDFEDPKGQSGSEDVMEFMSGEGLTGRSFHGKTLFGRGLRRDHPDLWLSTLLPTLKSRFKARVKRRFPLLARSVREFRRHVR